MFNRKGFTGWRVLELIDLTEDEKDCLKDLNKGVDKWRFMMIGGEVFLDRYEGGYLFPQKLSNPPFNSIASED